MNTAKWILIGFIYAALLVPRVGVCQAASDAEAAVRRALASMQTIQRNGGWAMAWSSDLKLTMGEHQAREENIITVQHPATPGTAMAFLKAYQVLKDEEYLKTAIAAGDALIAGQLDCGGFKHEFYPGDGKDGSGTFDDDVTQSATRFFIDLWNVTKEPRFEAAAKRCLQFMLDAQYENGGFPQAFPLRDNYSRYITLNDDAMMDVVRALFLGYHTFGEQKYFDAAVQGADCLLWLQGEPPQAGWAQQFTEDGLPASARRFEPVGYSSSESRRALDLLVEAYIETGDKKYLQAGERAFEWLRSSQLPNGRWARLYEPGTNRAIYSTEEGETIYDVANARPGYGWQGNFYSESQERRFEKLLAAPVEERKEIYDPYKEPDEKPSQDRVRRIIEELDENGRWLGPLSGRYRALYTEKFGEPDESVGMIHSGLFVRNVETLLAFLNKP